jgi:hypothetical protein
MQYMSTGGTAILGDHEIRADRVHGQTGVLKNLSHVAQRGLRDGKNDHQRMQGGIVSHAQPHTSAGLRIFRFKKNSSRKNYKKGVIPNVIHLMEYPVINPGFSTLCFFGPPDIFRQIPLHLLA